MEALEQAAKVHGKGMMIPLQADITSKESVTKLFEELGKREDKLHLLVNNAGIAGPTRTFEKVGLISIAKVVQTDADTAVIGQGVC